MADDVFYYKTKKFKELHKKWAKKLENSGFDDIEDTLVPTQTRTGKAYETLKKHHNHWFKANYTAEHIEEMQDYYRMLTAFGARYKFESKREKLIWDMYAEGEPLRNIRIALRKNGHSKRTSLDAINHVVHLMLKEIEREALIWKMHQEGWGIEEIQAELTVKKYRDTDTKSINNVIKKLEACNES